jgi:hypothetical protein
MGFLEFQEHNIEAARNWYAQAVKLDSQSYLAHYYFAAISMSGSMSATEQNQVESSLRASIKLNPNFAPSYDRLGALLVMRPSSLDEARLTELKAVKLDPGNLSYRLNTANILLQMGRGSEAITVIRNALPLTSSPQETAMAENFLMHAQEYSQAQAQNRNFSEQMNLPANSVDSTSQALKSDSAVSASAQNLPVPNAPHHFLSGVLSNVRCAAPAMDLNVTSAGKTLGLHTNNYFKIEYSVLDVTLKGDLHPCADLEGRSAKVEYVDSFDKNAAFLLAVEIHK